MSRRVRENVVSVGYIQPMPGTVDEHWSWGDYEVDHHGYKVTMLNRKGIRIELFEGKFSDAKQLFYVHPLQESFHCNHHYQDNIEEVLERGKMSWNGVVRIDCRKLRTRSLSDLMRHGYSGYKRLFDFRNLGGISPAFFARRVVAFYKSLLDNRHANFEYWLPIRVHVPTGKGEYLDALETEFMRVFRGGIRNEAGGAGFKLEHSIYLSDPPAPPVATVVAGAGRVKSKATPDVVDPSVKEVITIAEDADLYHPENIARHTRDLTSAIAPIRVDLLKLTRSIKKDFVQQFFNALAYALKMPAKARPRISRVTALQGPVSLQFNGEETTKDLQERIHDIVVRMSSLSVAELYEVQQALLALHAAVPSSVADDFFTRVPQHISGLIQDLRLEKGAEPIVPGGAVPVAPPSVLADVGGAPAVDEAKVDAFVDPEDDVGDLAKLGGVAYTAVYYAGDRPVRISVVQGDMADYVNLPDVATVNLVNTQGVKPHGGLLGLEGVIRNLSLSGVAKATRNKLSAGQLADITDAEDEAFKAFGKDRYDQGDMMAIQLPSNVDGHPSLMLNEFPPKFHGKSFEGEVARFYQQTQYRLMEMARLRRYRKFASPIAGTGNHGLNIKQGAKAMAHAYKAQIDQHAGAFDEVVIVVRADKDNSPQRVLAAADQISDIFGVSLVPTKKGEVIDDPKQSALDEDAQGLVFEMTDDPDLLRAYACPPPGVPSAPPMPAVSSPPTAALFRDVKVVKPKKTLKQLRKEALARQAARKLREKAERDMYRGYSGGAPTGGCCVS